VYWLARPGEDGGRKGGVPLAKIPKFVLGFLFNSLLATFHAFDKAQIASLANLSRWPSAHLRGSGLKTTSARSAAGRATLHRRALAELTVTAVTLGLVWPRRRSSACEDQARLKLSSPSF